MKIKEIMEAAPTLEAEPTPADIKAVEDLLGTIDVTTEKPQSLLGKLTGWMREYPLLDKVTDIIPQTRLVKAIADAADAIEAGNSQGALTALASGLTGSVGKAVGQANALVNVGSNLAQGDVKGAALAAGGTVGKVAKAADVTQNLAQNNLQGAAQAAGGGVAKVATLANKAQTAPDELDRVKQLARV